MKSSPGYYIHFLYFWCPIIEIEKLNLLFFICMEKVCITLNRKHSNLKCKFDSGPVPLTPQANCSFLVTAHPFLSWWEIWSTSIRCKKRKHHALYLNLVVNHRKIKMCSYMKPTIYLLIRIYTLVLWTHSCTPRAIWTSLMYLTRYLLVLLQHRC